MSIIQQLEDLKEWSKDSTRYERRLAFRGHMPSTEAGTIPLEFDELSDREQEYYRTGPWSTREDYQKGQLVQPGPGRQGYGGPGSGGGAWSGPKSAAAREKAYIKTFEAQKEFLKKNKRLPTREELIKITKSGPLSIRSAMKKYGFELFNKPGEFKTPPEKKEASYKKRTETVRSQPIDEPKTIKTQGQRVGVRFPSPKVEEEFIMDLSERFKYPKSSVEGTGKFLSNDALLKKYYTGKKGFDAASKLDEQIALVVKKEGFTYPRQTYEGHKKVSELNKRRRQKFIKKTSSPKMEAILRNLKAGEKIDLAHRASLRETARQGTKYLATSLGLDQTKINQEVVKPFEKEIGKLYDKRNKLVKDVKPGKVPKAIQLQLEDINKKVSEHVDKTNGRLQGILINEKTLKPSRVGVDYTKVLGFGLVEDKPVSKLTKADLINIELNVPEQIKAEKDFLKLAPPKSTAKTIPAATTKGRIDDALKGNKFKGLRNLLKGELWFAGADFINNLTKGQSIEKAFKKAVETASFEMKDLDADETAIIKHATEQGASEEEVGALRNYLNYMKKYKNYERANKMLHYAKENLGEGTGSPEDIGTTWEDVTSARENLKLREKEMSDLQATYEEGFEGTPDMQLGNNMLTKYMNSLAAEEWNKTAGTLIDRGSRTKQGEGLVWNPIGALTRDIGGLFSGKMPTEFYEATIGKFPSLLDPRIKEKEKQIRIMERPAVGVEYPEYQQALEDMKFDLGYALPEQNYAGGGIAGLSGGKRFGPPPLSGPMPQGGGLSSQYNRVKKLTE